MEGNNAKPAIASSSVIIICGLLLKEKRLRKRRRQWSSTLYLNRSRDFAVNSTYLLNNVILDQQHFANFNRISTDVFYFLLSSIREKIFEKSSICWRTIGVNSAFFSNKWFIHQLAVFISSIKAANFAHCSKGVQSYNGLFDSSCRGKWLQFYFILFFIF